MNGLGSLELRRVILHEVPTGRRGEEVTLVLSTAIVDLHDDHRRYLQERLRKALGLDARDVVEMDEPSSDVPKRVAEFLSDDAGGGFVEMSQRLAERLKDVQTGANSPGLLLVADCSLLRRRALLVAKVELERGVRAQQTTLKDGSTTYDVQLLTDLVFGETSRVFKIGLFPAAGITDAGVAGWAVDRQTGGPELAGFFLHDYLGCEYAQRPDVLTKDFFDKSQAWINSLADDERKARYEVALLAEMQKARTEVRPREFARENLEPDDRDPFLAALPPALNRQAFTKSTDLVPLRRMKVETRQGVSVYADPSLVGTGKVVQVAENQILVQDEVVKVGGDGRARRGRRGTTEASVIDDVGDGPTT